MSKLYRYYQRVGGEETWTPIQAEQNLETISPTFITVLALDTLIEDQPTREALEAVKYLGPMYFDLDSAELSDSIAGGQALMQKLLESGLQESDIEIYLSGKKGLHFLIAPICFMEKVQASYKLPAIYKEMAFRLAVDTVDFKVYTARKGRMLRTCFNIRENGNYRVPISATELASLTPETYNVFCSAKRNVSPTNPKFRPEFALIYDASAQKIQSARKKKSKPTTAQELKRVLPDVKKILKNEGLSDIGFNKIAMQLCVYAREANWSEDSLVESAAELINNHASDGSRYNTPRRREAEIRRMFAYVDDNPAYEYSPEFLRSCLAREAIRASSDRSEGFEAVDGDDEEEDFTLTGGVYVRGNSYLVSKGDDGDIEISNFVFRDPELVLDTTDNKIIAIRTYMSKKERVTLVPSNFTGSTALQNIVSGYGKSFTGTDTHARGIFQIMLKEVNKNNYLVDSEGLNWVSLPVHPDPEVANTPFLAWADRFRVVVPEWVKEKGISLEFLGYPEDKGVLQTDLTKAPNFQRWLAEDEGNAEIVNRMFRHLLASNHPESIAKCLGWMVASHWRQLFQAKIRNFPLLHIYGPAGSGKTQLSRSLLKLFYYQQTPKETTPTESTPFSLLCLLAGSASIPIMLDEWKPSRMNREIGEKYRAMLRASYDGKEVQRGGGSRTKDNFNALNVSVLSAPLLFISEALETEKAIFSRSVILPFRKAGPQQVTHTFNNFQKYLADGHVLSMIGKHIITMVLRDGSYEQFSDDYDRMIGWAVKHYLIQADDQERLERGEINEDDMRRKQAVGDDTRGVESGTAVMFGLVKLRQLLDECLGDKLDREVKTKLKALQKYAYAGLASVSKILPEYMKVLSAMSDMSRVLMAGGEKALVENAEYNLSELGGKPVIVIAPRFAYNRYRQYMRLLNQIPLYPDELAFETALSEVPAFMTTGTGTKNIQTRTLILDIEALEKEGVPPFAGRAVDLKLT